MASDAVVIGSGSSLNRRVVLVICATAVPLGLARNMWYWTMPLHVKNLGLSPLYMGLSFALILPMEWLMVILGGILTDRGKARSALLLGGYCTAAATLLLTQPLSVPAVVTLLALAYGGLGLVLSPAASLLMSVQGHGSRATVYGRYLGCYGAGLMAGAYLGGRLVGRYGFTGVFWVSAAVMMACTLGRHLGLPRGCGGKLDGRTDGDVPVEEIHAVGSPPVPDPGRPHTAWRSLAPRFWLLIACQSIYYVGSGLVFPTFWAPYARDVLGFSGEVVGTMIAYDAAGWLVASVLGGWLADRWGHARVIAAGWALIAVTSFLYTFSSTLALLYSTSFLIGAGAGFYLGPSQALSSILVPRRLMGRAVGLIAAAPQLAATAAGPALGGWLSVTYSARAPFTTHLLFGVIMASVYTAWDRRLAATERGRTSCSREQQSAQL